MLIHVDTELGAKDLLNNRMAYVAVSRGAHDAQLFTNDREGLESALGRNISHRSAQVSDIGYETAQQQQGVTPRAEQSYGLGLSL